jgi:hypothetical protein
MGKIWFTNAQPLGRVLSLRQRVEHQDTSQPLKVIDTRGSPVVASISQPMLTISLPTQPLLRLSILPYSAKEKDKSI